MRTQRAALSKRQRYEERLGWLFVLPVVLGIGIFQLYPTLFSLYASLTQWNLLTPPRYVGLQNYVDLFTTDRFFAQTMTNTGVYTLGHSAQPGDPRQILLPRHLFYPGGGPGGGGGVALGVAL
ncbi:MAG TPA: hypothetical protein PKE45_26440 [Caldilineaceae bacterium]|nr:hypothetical protein [Caldilineaceae bacterium]